MSDNVVLPALGESVTEGTVTRWLKKVGDSVAVDEPLVEVSTDDPKKVLLAAPRGYCAGVDRAVVAVEKALDQFGAPVYVRKEIVHNVEVVASLTERGAIFVNEVDEVPEGSHLVFSAHGVSPKVKSDAFDRNLMAIDATCPLVTKVHREAERLVFQIESVALRTLDALHLSVALLGLATHVVTYDARMRTAALQVGLKALDI
jgi:hypothetical protein